MRPSWTLLTACLGLFAGRLAWAEIPPQLRMYMKRSRVAQAYDMLMPLLAASPDDPELHAVYGSLMAQTGDHADAVTAFAFSDGASWYASSGMRQHASSLSALGYTDEAIAIRQLARLNPRRDEATDVLTFMAMVDDYREARRWEEGQDTLDELLGMSSGAKVWAAATRFYTDKGDLDEAFWASLQAMRTADPFECKLARANLYMQMGDLEAAEQILVQAKRRRARHIGLGAILAELERRKGNPVMALEITRLRRYNDTPHIDLRAAEVRALIDLMAYDEAQDVLDRLRAYEATEKHRELVTELAAARSSAD